MLGVKQFGFILFCFFVIFDKCTCEQRDPYEILGVSRRASQQEIKRSYKKLAREWHPDKNKADTAEAKFVEINQAYELLSDPERKERYDRYGEFSDSPHKDAGGFQGDFPFGNFGPFQFRYQSSSNFFSKHRITLRMYENNLLEQSFKKPYILFAYSDWCLSCLQAEPIWEKIVNDLDAVGYGIGTVNNMLDGTLINRIRVRHLPSIVLLLEGRTVHYRGVLNVKDVTKFAKDSIPKYFVTTVTDRNLKRFLGEWKSCNKVSVLMFGPNDRPRLRYILAAVRFQNFGRFGYVQLGNSDSEIREALDIRSSAGETVLIFNDRPESGPVATLAMKVVSTDSLLNLVDNNKYLLLPRLSSQQLFDDLCPPNSGFSSKSHVNRKLCAILLVDNDRSDDIHVDSFRDFVEFYAEQIFSKEKIRFLYMYSDVQSEFVNALKPPNLEPDSSHRDVVIVWRTEKNQAKFDWLRKIWNGHKDRYNQSSEMLVTKVNGYLQGKSVLSRDAALKQLVDEFRPGWLARVARKAIKLWESVVYHVTKEELLPALSIVGTLVLIMLIGYGLNYAVAMEEKAEMERKNRRAAAAASERNKTTTGGQTTRRENQALNLLRELRAETSFGMLRLLKPGHRTIAVLVDSESKDQLLKDFAACIWPWRNNKTLMFGFVMVEKNLSWFRQLLEYTIPAEDGSEEFVAGERMLKRINPKQVVGTVLSMNGFRLYFCMYHPKHAPSMVGYKPKRSGGKFLGLEGDSSDSDSETELRMRREMAKKKELKAEELLQGLPNWLDRLFEGSTRRYYIPEWPQMR